MYKEAPMSTFYYILICWLASFNISMALCHCLWPCNGNGATHFLSSTCFFFSLSHTTILYNKLLYTKKACHQPFVYCLPTVRHWAVQTRVSCYQPLSSAWYPLARMRDQRCPPRPAPPQAGCLAHTAPGQPPAPTGRLHAQWNRSWGGSAHQQTRQQAGDTSNINTHTYKKIYIIK